MTRFDIIQVSADRGIAPGSTKGAAQHLRGIAGGLHRRGHRVTTYTPRRAEGRFPTALLPLEDLARIGHHAGGDDRRIVYERYSLGHSGGLELARRLGIPFVLEVNAPLVDEATGHRPDTLGPTDARVEAELLDAADLVITVSTALAEWADARRAGPTIVVANGYEPAWFERPATPGTPRFPLVFIGHPKPWHGADRLVDLLAALARIDRRPDLLVIGGGPGADTLRTAARDAGVGAQLTITGPLPPDEASAMLQHGGIGLAPYRRQDSFYFCPLKIIDYLAAGLAVVATDQGDIGELVGTAGLVVPPDDDHRLVDAVVALLDDPAARAVCGVHGRSRAMTSMTWDHVAERTEAAMLTHLSPFTVDA
ncbi:MAG: glycosyltransferase family 4 protein [Acidimicrobiales bacterium]